MYNYLFVRNEYCIFKKVSLMTLWVKRGYYGGQMWYIWSGGHQEGAVNNWKCGVKDRSWQEFRELNVILKDASEKRMFADWPDWTPSIFEGIFCYQFVWEELPV